MKVILDINVILSALIRDSITRKIILDSGFEFYFPEYSLHKIRKYKKYILEKSGLLEEDYDKLIGILFKYIKLISTEEIDNNFDKADKIIGHIDSEDVVFIASALSVKDSIIWSDDKHFDKQDKIKVLKTNDLV